ncbi:MarR family winged helix-turn-helix transcriptional regulator [Mycolicibacterium sp. BiH015]|uniref:MarR family winged helix-turn-helix transcriptional regulator n=1 Tax=Mycolicibacterium sp. BiH015 TaxID=3018808 RepID=UPI0022E0A990|nr:MarR family winged helix-turn-helix transcriptional regulator [Mycolicibacterium sp. BiH015]MDA2890634.1 MarR family winged helix-turn-helix transcriptional regulator [Mycolicibacterium sp. BiH015]
MHLGAPSTQGRGDSTGALRHQQHIRLLESLRRYSADYTYLNRHLAAWLGVHTVDAAAYAEILYAQDRGAPLTPALLAKRLAMTSGATTSLLNRLETAGLIVRSRESQDRRVVTLRSDPAIKNEAPRFFGPLGQLLDAVMADYDTEFLEQVGDLIDRLHHGMDQFLTRPEDEITPRSTPVRSQRSD